MVGPRLKIFPMNYYAAVAGSLRVSVACKAVLAGDFIPFLLLGGDIHPNPGTTNTQMGL